MRLGDLETKENRPRDAENAVGTAGHAENIVDERNPDNLAHTHRDDQQIVPAQMDDRPRQHQSDQARQQAADRQGPENADAQLRIEVGGGIGAHGVKRRMPHVVHAGIPQNDIQAERQQRIQTDIVENIHLIGIQVERYSGHRRDKGAYAPHPAIHILSATLSPKSPLGRAMRITISTKNAMASFQATDT